MSPIDQNDNISQAMPRQFRMNAGLAKVSPLPSRWIRRTFAKNSSANNVPCARSNDLGLAYH
jgi:hypothetical protein